MNRIRSSQSGKVDTEVVNNIELIGCSACGLHVIMDDQKG